MITPSMDVKSTLSPIVQKSLAITQLFTAALCVMRLRHWLSMPDYFMDNGSHPV